jgi:uncharacterized protein (TIGR03083 family)
MPTSLIPPTDTRAMFRPVVAALVDLLRDLPGGAWQQPTIAGRWRVRDVVAHLLDTALRRLSFERDGYRLEGPRYQPSSPAELVALVNDLNSLWVEAATRLSPTILTRLYAAAGAELADFFESCALDAPPLFPVSWAGEDGGHGWMDIGREFTEQWHHQMQVRDAVGAAPLADPRWHHAVLLITIRGLPHAYDGVPGAPGASLVLEISGDAGGTFTLRHDGQRWRILSGSDPGRPDARVVLTDDTAWRLLFNGLTTAQAEARIHVEGTTVLTRPLFSARSVIV